MRSFLTVCTKIKTMAGETNNLSQSRASDETVVTGTCCNDPCRISGSTREMGGLLSRGPAMVTEEVIFFVDNFIASKPVIVFSKTYCPYCTKAKNVLQKYKIPESRYEVLELEKRPDCSEIQTYLRQLTGASSVPRVFIQQKCIGGGDETAALDQRGELKDLLLASGAIDA